MIFDVIIGIAGVVSGAVAAVAGFGIGSILTPVLALHTDTKTAVAAVSIPHFLGTALRLWRLRRYVDRRVFFSFGITSAAGGLLGALLHSYAGSPALAAVFGGLLIFAGITGLSWFGWASQTGGSLSGAPFGFPDAGIQIAAPTPPEISLSVNGYFSSNTNHLGVFDRGAYTFREDVTIQRGRHEIHVGGEAVRI